MGQVSSVLRRGVDRDGLTYYIWWCPGCKHAHSVPVGGEHPRCWTFNGDLEKPTFSPSVRHFIPARPARDEYPALPEKTFCHYFIEAGQIKYCGDCTHVLNGQTVDMVALSTIEGYGWGDADA